MYDLFLVPEKSEIRLHPVPHTSDCFMRLRNTSSAGAIAQSHKLLSNIKILKLKQNEMISNVNVDKSEEMVDDMENVEMIDGKIEIGDEEL